MKKKKKKKKMTMIMMIMMIMMMAMMTKMSDIRQQGFVKSYRSGPRYLSMLNYTEGQK
jgi:flagellar basal body-associated protein FliL